MTQHSMSVPNGDGATVRAGFNSALQALASSSGGATEPSTTYPNQPWYDTATNIRKIRNEDNDAWISVMPLDQSADTIDKAAFRALVSALTTRGDITTRGASAEQRLALGASGTFLKSDGTDAVWGLSALPRLATLTASSSAVLDFTAMDSAIYQGYVFCLREIVPATDAADLWLRASVDGGSSFNAATAYWYGHGYMTTGGVFTTGAGATAAAQAVLCPALDSAGAGLLNGDLWWDWSGSRSYWHHRMVHFENAGTALRGNQGFGFANLNTVNAVRFMMSTGNIASGSIYCYGIPKA